MQGDLFREKYDTNAFKLYLGTLLFLRSPEKYCFDMSGVFTEEN